MEMIPLLVRNCGNTEPHRNIFTVSFLTLMIFMHCFAFAEVSAGSNGSRNHVPRPATEYNPQKPLRTMIVQNYAPYSFVNERGVPDGFSIDLIRAVTRVMDMEIEISPGHWNDAIKALADGEIDLLPMMAYSAERDKSFDFSVPHTIAHDAFFVRKDSPRITSQSQLKDKSIIVMDMDQAHQYLRFTGLIPADRFILVDSLPEGLRALASGRGDVALMPKLVGLMIIKRLNLKNIDTNPAIIDGYNRPFSFAVVEGDHALLERLNQGLKIVKTTGTYQEIYYKWFGLLETHRGLSKDLLEYLLAGITILFVLGLIIGGWSIFLRRKVAERTHYLEIEIAERKHAEEAFRKSEERYRLLFDSAGDAIFVHDNNGQIMAANELAAKRYGYTREELLSMRICQIDTPAESIHAPERILRLMRQGYHAFETSHQCKDGSVIEMDVSARRITWDNGMPAMMSICRDITERKRGEANRIKALREAELRMQESTALLNAAAAVLENTKFEPAARRIFAQCKQITGATGGYVALLDSEGRENEVLFLDAGGRSCSVDPNLPMPVRGLREKAYQSGKPVYENDFPRSEWMQFIPSGHVSLDNVMFAPLPLEGSVVGVIGLANKPGGFDENDARMATGMGEIAAVALRNSMNLQSLEASEVRFRSVVETASDAIITINQKGHVVLWNMGAEKVFGYTPGEIMGRDISSLIPAEYSQHHRDAIGHVTESGLRHCGRILEVTGLRKDGSEIPIEFTATKWQTKEGVFFTSVIRDITDRKRAENEIVIRNRIAQVFLTASDEEMYKGVLEILLCEFESPHGLFGFVADNGDLVIPSMTHHIWDDCNIPEKSIVFPQSTWNDSLWGCALREGQSKYANREFRVPQGHVPVTSFLTVPIRLHGRSIGLLSLGNRPGGYTDEHQRLLEKIADFISPILSARRERDRYQQESRKLQESLARSEKMESLGQIAGGVAHDLNNVLGVSMAYAELIYEQLSEESPLRKSAESILSSTQKAAALIEDFLTMARRGVMVSAVTNLNHNVTGFLHSPVFANIKAMNPGATISVELAEDIMNIKGSPIHLEKTLTNLVSNAVEAISGAGTVTIRTENRYIDRPVAGYDAVHEGEYVVLTVSDTGAGIPPDHLGKIFEPFYTRKTMGKNSGTGLGLAIVWGTVKDHHGYIDVTSEVGKGSIFTLYFPATREETAHDAASVRGEEYAGQGEAVLVIDDSADQRQVATALLTRLGYRVSSVSSGEEAIEYLKVNKADVLVLDMIMDPGMDGLDTYRGIIKHFPHQRAIIVSGFAETERVQETQRLGAGAFVKKPYMKDKIGVAIRAELKRK